jgi:hypothetical protein
MLDYLFQAFYQRKLIIKIQELVHVIISLRISKQSMQSSKNEVMQFVIITGPYHNV